MIITPLVILGLSNPLTMTPLLPEMGEVVKEMVSKFIIYCAK
jgi:hypothetical protein